MKSEQGLDSFSQWLAQQESLLGSGLNIPLCPLGPPKRGIYLLQAPFPQPLKEGTGMGHL